jgi:hypothetical protein
MPATTSFDLFWTSRVDKDDDHLLQEWDKFPKTSQPAAVEIQSDGIHNSNTRTNSPTLSYSSHDMSPEVALSCLDVRPTKPRMLRSLTSPRVPPRHDFPFCNHEPMHTERDMFPRFSETSSKANRQLDWGTMQGESRDVVSDDFYLTRHAAAPEAWPTLPAAPFSTLKVPSTTEGQLGVSLISARSSFSSTNNQSTLAYPVDDAEQCPEVSNSGNNPFRTSNGSIFIPLINPLTEEIGICQAQTTCLSLSQPKPNRIVSPLFLHKSSVYPKISVRPVTPSSSSFPRTITSQPDPIRQIDSSAGILENTDPLSPPVLVRPALRSYPLLSRLGPVRRIRSPSFPVGIGASLSSSNPYLLRESPYHCGLVYCQPNQDVNSTSSAHERTHGDGMTGLSRTETPTPRPRHPVVVSSEKKSICKVFHGLPFVGLIGCLWLGNFLVALLSAMIPIAVPKISTQLHGMRDIGLYTSSYYLFLATFLPFFYRMYQVFNPKIIFLTSVLVFQGSSIVQRP